jgi:hypothetical protein
MTNVEIKRGIRVLSGYDGRFHLSGNKFQFDLKAMRLAIPHPERPGDMILFCPEDVSVLFHPEFMSQEQVNPE